MRTKKTTIPKPIKDFSNINSTFEKRIIYLDEEKNGKLNLVKIKKKTSKVYSKK